MTGTADARELAEAAADRAGVDVRLVSSPAEARQASALFAAVWPRANGEPPALPEMARALAHAGNYVSIAQRGAEVIGAALGFRGADKEGPLLHSHLAGVLPGLEARHVGFALKQHQRAWAIDQGFERVTWTFDPLVARNAYFNVSKLGGELTAYYVDFYGPLDDGINSGSPTDRCLLTWRVNSARAAAAAAEKLPPPVVPDGARVVLEPGPDGMPILTPGDADTLVCRLPVDIVGIRHADATVADSWRAALRAIFVDAFGEGRRVTAVTRDGRYILERS